MKKKKNTHTAVNEKRKTDKSSTFIIYCFVMPFKIIINFFISQAHSQRIICFLVSR